MDEERERPRVGTAGWSIASQWAGAFPEAGSHLERYAARLSAVEINSSFYRPHRPATYVRWAAATPPGFRFAVKMPKAITHGKRLHDISAELERFLAECGQLGDRLGPLLVQLPPSLAFDPERAVRFWAGLRARHAGPVVCEPRHPSWFADPAERELDRWSVARVAADPPPCPGADQPGGWPGLIYRRLHGSPQIYRSPYGAERLAALAESLAAAPAPAWCVFDNTADFAATGDALALDALLARPPAPRAARRSRESGGRSPGR